jgi:hypothetical protein
MDIISYLLGKNSGGGGGGSTSKYFQPTITAGSSSNAAPTAVLSMVKTIPENTIVEGYSLSYSFKYYQGETIPLLDTSNVTDMSYMFRYANNLRTIPLLDTSRVTTMASMFQNCSNLIEIPLLNTAEVIYMGTMFNGCTRLETIPILNTSKATTIGNMFVGCGSLTDNSLDNILQMCINAISYTGAKTLAVVGLTSTYYSAERIQALPHYQDFINAGWTIGY